MRSKIEGVIYFRFFENAVKSCWKDDKKQVYSQWHLEGFSDSDKFHFKQDSFDFFEKSASQNIVRDAGV